MDVVFTLDGQEYRASNPLEIARHDEIWVEPVIICDLFIGHQIVSWIGPLETWNVFIIKTGDKTIEIVQAKAVAGYYSLACGPETRAYLREED